MGEWLSPQSLVAIAALITAAVGSFTQLWKERRSAPIDKETANVAAFSSISSANKNAVDSFIQLTKEQREEIDRKDKALDDERRKVTLWELWHDTLKLKWNEFRVLDYAPRPPDYDKD